MRAICYIDEKRCTGCGLCVSECPGGAVSLEDGVAHVDGALCRGCAACADVCPAGAVTLVAPASVPVPSGPVQPAWREEPPQGRAELPVITIPRPPSLLSRLAGTAGPVLLSLAAGLGRALLDARVARAADRTRRGAAQEWGPGGRRGAQMRRRGGRRGRW